MRVSTLLWSPLCSELAELKLEHMQQRDERWVILDLYGKGGQIRTVPMPGWVKTVCL
jgi:hypothetical protein